MGLPKEHFDFVQKNTQEEGATPALAITNHGHMSSYAHAYLYVKELKKAGRDFKFLPGCELYVHPDLAEWRRQKDIREADGEDASEHGSTVENEEETKSNKFLDPIRRMHHLVVLAKHSKGLENLFSIVSRGYIEGFYKKPRVDYSWLKPFKGDFVVSTACVGGPLSWDVFSEFPNVAFDVRDDDAEKRGFLGPQLVDDPAVMERVLRKMENTVDRLTDAVGKENFFLELQFNRLSAQHLANRLLIELSKRTGLNLVVTADSHYCRPDVWKERAIYQKLGWMNYTDYDPSAIPQSIEELKCELYPKNAAQIWDSYLKSGPGAGYKFYDDQIVCDAIERTHDIAFQMIDDVSPDTSVKLPSWSVPQGKTAIQALRELCNDGMRKMGLDGTSSGQWKKKEPQQTYAERLEYELSVIEEKKFSEYFLTMKAIIDVATERMLIGAARGSAAGSLVNYVLGITLVDPLEYDLIFERFINPLRSEFPDIDCLVSNMLVQTPHGYKRIDELREGDEVFDVEESCARKVLAVATRFSTFDDVIITFFVMFKTGAYGALTCNHLHRLYISDAWGNQTHVSRACDIRVGQRMISSGDESCVIVGKLARVKPGTSLTDITVEGSSSFRVIPYDVVEIKGHTGDLLICIDEYDIDADKAYDISTRIQESEHSNDCGIISI